MSRLGLRGGLNILLAALTFSSLFSLTAKAECCRIGSNEWKDYTRGISYVGFAMMPANGLPRGCHYLWLIADCPFTTYDYICLTDCAECPSNQCYHKGQLMLAADTGPGCEFISVCFLS